MAPRTKTRLTQNTTKKVPAATPVLQKNTKDRPVLVDKTNQIVTVKALRNRKVYRDQNTETVVTVSKKLFKSGVQSPRAASKRQASNKKLAAVPQKNRECFVVLEKADKVNNHKSPAVGKQTTTKRLRNITQKNSKCSVSLEKNIETKIEKKLVYNDISPPSAEKQKTCTPEKKIMLYDFKGGSGSNSSSSRKRARKRKPVRKRKAQVDTSDEENCGIHNDSKKMKILASSCEEKQKDCSNIHSQTFQPFMNSSVQPLRDQNALSNQSVKTETKKFFKTPMRKQLVEMSLFNYTNQKKNRCFKSSKTLSRKKENSKSCRTKQNLLLVKSFDTSNKLPTKPVTLNVNRVQSGMSNTATVNSSKIPVLKPTTSKSKIPVLVKPATSDSKPPLLVKPETSNSKPSELVKPTTSNGEPPQLKKPTTSSTKPELEKVNPQAAVADKTEVVNCTETVDVEISAAEDLSTKETASKVAEAVSRINYKRGGTNFGLDFTLGESEPESSKQTDKSVPVSREQTTLPVRSIIPASTVRPAPVAKQMKVEKDKNENNYFIGPVRSFQFLERYSRHTRRYRMDGLYVPSAPSTEHFTLENYFGFVEEPEDDFILSPVKQQSDANITGPPLTSTPHTANTKSIHPQPNRLLVKTKLREANVSISASQNNCSQILARGGCGFKNKSSVVSSTKTATFAVPQPRNIPSSAAKNTQSFIGASSCMVQASITDYLQNDKEVSCVSDVPFDTSLSNIEADELSVTHTQPPRRSYERPIRKRRYVERDDYVSEEEEEEEPQTNTLSRKHSRSKRQKRSKKHERMFEKWASNVSSQFEEIDSMALIVE